MSKKSFPKRREIYWVNLNPTIGCETKKLRPGLIVSNDIANEASELVMIAPISSQVKRVFPFEVQFTLNDKPNKVMLNQVRAIDKARLGSKIGIISAEIMVEVERAIRIVFGLS